MQGIYTHIPETNYVPREYGVAAILLFLLMVLISLVSVLHLLYFYTSTFRSMCAGPNMAVFCSSLTSWFPGMLLTYFLNVFEIVNLYYYYYYCYYYYLQRNYCTYLISDLSTLNFTYLSSEFHTVVLHTTVVLPTIFSLIHNRELRSPPTVIPIFILLSPVTHSPPLPPR